MKKKYCFKVLIISLVSILLGINSIYAQHYKKDGTPDKRYKENRTSSYSRNYTRSYSNTKSYYTSSYPSVKRDNNGKIHRDESAKHKIGRAHV